ncbi:MAG: DUF4386 domain-containing protein [Saprospiraceae bacterium]
MNHRTLALTAGISYLVIFFAAIFANFMALESILQTPVETIRDSPMMVRLGIMAFLITAVFDVIVAWALYELYKNNPLSNLSTWFRIMHAAIMGIAVFALLQTLSYYYRVVLSQASTFNNIWLIGLFFFGVHLILLGRIIGKPKIIALFGHCRYYVYG